MEQDAGRLPINAIDNVPEGDSLQEHDQGKGLL